MLLPIRVHLRSLILWFCVFFVAAVLANTFYATYVVKRDILLQDTLEANRVYAEKLARVTENYLRSCRRLLFAVGEDLEAGPLAPGAAQEAVDHMLRVSDLFNELLVVNTDSVVIADTDAAARLVGQRVDSQPARLALAARGPLTSQPFRLGESGRWVVMLSHPMYDANNEYIGYVAGLIYLHQPAILQAILGEHTYLDGTYGYVVDSGGALIYHPSSVREGEVVHNPAEQAVRRGERGAMRFVNQEGVEMLGGYAPVPSVGWGVIIQKPTEAALERVDAALWRTLMYALPLIGLSLFGIWWLSGLITRPLRALASAATAMQDPGTPATVRAIRGWYQEAADLRRGLLIGLMATLRRIRTLRRESESDPLTGLLNRRGLQSVVDALAASGTPFAIITFDIDRFKTINDTFGHHVGDLSVQEVARAIEQQARQRDAVARLGGDEFMIILPRVPVTGGAAFAERLRQVVASLRVEGGRPMTISVGVAHFPLSGATVEEAFQNADRALYDAKEAGRDRTFVYEAHGTRPAAELDPANATHQRR
ncbi:MAG: sensor domain-containing diguanylate cyclase [Bordetella sp.]|nr:sensor domain-containing diguanylate cyclase [Bordetella sp.]